MLALGCGVDPLQKRFLHLLASTAPDLCLGVSTAMVRIPALAHRLPRQCPLDFGHQGPQGLIDTPIKAGDCSTAPEGVSQEAGVVLVLCK